MNPPVRPVNFNLLLRQLNQIRVAFEMPEIAEISPGVQSEANDCPIAISLRDGWHAEVMGAYTEFTWSGHRHEMPAIEPIVKALKQIRWIKKVEITSDYNGKPKGIVITNSAMMTNFIYRFDSGDFKDLVLGPQPKQTPPQA